MLSTAAAMGMPGVLMTPLRAEYGWSTATVSGALALRIALYGLMAPFAAALIARYGLRVVVAVATVLIVGGIALATRMTAPWEMWLTWWLLVGIGTGTGTGMTAMVAGGDRREPLVRRAPRPRDRHSDRECGNRQPDLPAARRSSVGSLRLALGAGAARLRLRGGRSAGDPVRPRPPGRSRPRPVRGHRHCPAPRTGWPRGGAGVRDPARGVRHANVLAAVRHVLRLRAVDQRADRHPFRRPLPRLRHGSDGRGRRAGADGGMRFRRHHRLRLAHRPDGQAARCCSPIMACAGCR